MSAEIADIQTTGMCLNPCWNDRLFVILIVVMKMLRLVIAYNVTICVNANICELTSISLEQINPMRQLWRITFLMELN